MPVYSIKLTIPANTSANSPVETSFKVEGDVLTKIIVLIPAGVRALAGIAIFYGIKQIFPYEEGQWITGDNESIPFDVYIKLPEHPCILKLKGYNSDTKYDHTFYVRLTTGWEYEIYPWRILYDAMKLLAKFLKRIGV